MTTHDDAIRSIDVLMKGASRGSLGRRLTICRELVRIISNDPSHAGELMKVFLDKSDLIDPDGSQEIEDAYADSAVDNLAEQYGAIVNSLLAALLRKNLSEEAFYESFPIIYSITRSSRTRTERLSPSTLSGLINGFPISMYPMESQCLTKSTPGAPTILRESFRRHVLSSLQAFTMRKRSGLLHCLT